MSSNGDTIIHCQFEGGDPEMDSSHNSSVLALACSVSIPTPLSLLSLPDHILRQIGDYISEDFQIPYPAFGPTWQNLLPPRSSLRPLCAFREVSRQIHQTVPLSGTWLVINTMADLQKYAWMTDDELIGSVTMKLKIDDGFKDNSSNGVISILSHLVRLFQRTPNLRELRLARPVHIGEKHHAATKPPLTSLHLPLMHLPHLQHLYVKISCEGCASGLKAFLISLAPGLRSLKMYLPDSKGLEPLTTAIKLHQDRFGTPLMSLRTLFLRLGPGMDIEELLVVLAKGCQGLTDLHVSTYEKKEMRLVLNVEITINEEGDGKCETFEILTDTRVHLKSFWDNLRLLLNLEVLDLGMTISDGNAQTDPPPIARSPLSAQQSTRLVSAQKVWQAHRAADAATAPIVEKAAIWILMKTCPKLRKGWWWAHRSIDGQNSGELIYERRGWEAELRDSGKVAIGQNFGTLWLSSDFVNGYG